MTKKKLIAITGCIVLLLSMMVGGIVYLRQTPAYEQVKNPVSSNKTPNKIDEKDELKKDETKKDELKPDDSKPDDSKKDESAEAKPTNNKTEEQTENQKAPEQKPVEQKEQKPTEQKTPVATKPTSKPSQPAPSKPTSKPSQSVPSKPAPSKPQHTCTWTPIIEDVYHDAVGHYEQVLVKAAWTEERPIYETKAVEICNTCGQILNEELREHIKMHMLKGEGGSHRTEYIQQQTGTEKIEHPAEYKQEWVVDSKAWTEQVTVGYKCNGCGKTK